LIGPIQGFVEGQFWLNWKFKMDLPKPKVKIGQSGKTCQWNYPKHARR